MVLVWGYIVATGLVGYVALNVMGPMQIIAAILCFVFPICSFIAYRQHRQDVPPQPNPPQQ